MSVALCVIGVSLLSLSVVAWMFQTLAYEIKLGLKCKKGMVEVNVSIPFSVTAFESLKAAGYLRGRTRGCDVYGIQKLEDLDHLYWV